MSGIKPDVVLVDYADILKLTGNFLPIFGDSINSVGLCLIKPEKTSQLKNPFIDDKHLLIDEEDILLSNFSARYKLRSEAVQCTRFLPLFLSQNWSCLRSNS